MNALELWQISWKDCSVNLLIFLNPSLQKDKKKRIEFNKTILCKTALDVNVKSAI